MFQDGFTNITDVDFSENAVKIMQERYKERNIKINYEQMNVTEMTEFEKGQFQAVLDKGTLDSILCGEDAIPIVYKYLREVDRVLSDKGIFICISYGDEEHIIVQIPMKGNDSLQNSKNIEKAKAAIGKVVKIEFKEARENITEIDIEERKNLAYEIQAALLQVAEDFDTEIQRYQNTYENITIGTTQNLSEFSTLS
jgi:ubiquinone/menaquinone biosynthesis C-methylase UbiE